MSSNITTQSPVTTHYTALSLCPSAQCCPKDVISDLNWVVTTQAATSPNISNGVVYVNTKQEWLLTPLEDATALLLRVVRLTFLNDDNEALNRVQYRPGKHWPILPMSVHRHFKPLNANTKTHALQIKPNIMASFWKA